MLADRGREHLRNIGRTRCCNSRGNFYIVLKRCIDCIASQPKAETPQKNSKAKANAKAKAKASPLSKTKPSPVQSKLSPAKGKTKPSPKTKGKGKEKAKDSKEKTVTTKGAQKKRKDAAEAGHGHYFVLCALQHNKETGMWVCLKMGYTPNYSHLVGIMIIKHWV